MTGSKPPGKQRISIVFEDTGENGGQGFNVYLSGHKRNIFRVPPDERGPAEFWASKCMEIVVSVLKQSGVVKSEMPNPEDPTQH